MYPANLNSSHYCIVSQNKFAEPPSLRPELSAARDDCDWFKEMQKTHSVVFFSYPTMHLWRSQILLHGAVEIGLAMRDYV